MPKVTKGNLNYTDYSWRAVPGDDPTKTREDADRLSRNEGYEVVDFLNSFVGEKGVDLPVSTRQIIEWMIHEKLPSNIQGRTKVKAWVVENYSSLKPHYPF